MSDQKAILISIISAISDKLIAAENTLTELDSIGDADCGSGVRRGFEAVRGTLSELSGLEIGDILKKVGFTLAYTIGGTSGAMLGTGFIEIGKSIGENKDPAAPDWINAAQAALDMIKRRGGNTRIGDKTLVDALEPAIEAMKVVYDNFYKDKTGATEASSGIIETGNGTYKKDFNQSDDSIKSIIDAGYQAAKLGSDKTVEMTAKKGRASYLGERSRGNRDPGSLIIVLMFESAVEVLNPK